MGHLDAWARTLGAVALAVAALAVLSFRAALPAGTFGFGGLGDAVAAVAVGAAALAAGLLIPFAAASAAASLPCSPPGARRTRR